MEMSTSYVVVLVAIIKHRLGFHVTVQDAWTRVSPKCWTSTREEKCAENIHWIVCTQRAIQGSKLCSGWPETRPRFEDFFAYMQYICKVSHDALRRQCKQHAWHALFHVFVRWCASLHSIAPYLTFACTTYFRISIHIYSCEKNFF
jgi:hypothetical protein